MLQAKLTQNNLTNSPDSSEESSGGSPNHFSGGVDGPNKEAEEMLPSVVSYLILLDSALSILFRFNDNMMMNNILAFANELLYNVFMLSDVDDVKGQEENGISVSAVQHGFYNCGRTTSRSS